jgi:hypothetical protein
MTAVFTSPPHGSLNCDAQTVRGTGEHRNVPAAITVTVH